MMRAFIGGVTMAILAGCATAPREGATFVAPGLTFRTPAPAELGYAVRVAQLITARHGDETYVFEAELSVSAETLNLICIDSFGRRALTIASHGDRVEIERAPWLPSTLHAENILADIALVYWPADAVRRGFAHTRAVLNGDARRRTIAVGERDVITIEYEASQSGRWPRLARYRNVGFDYELTLRSAELP